MVRLLLVEDDETIANIIVYHLNQGDTYEITYVKNAGEALAVARYHYDIILLDVMLPDVDGISLCNTLRKWQQCPIIFISCLENNDMIVKALEMGGDDYLVKPFDTKVLNARIKASLRRVEIDRAQNGDGHLLICENFSLNPATQLLTKDNVSFALGNMEFRILMFLMQHPGKFFSASELYEKIWGRPSYGDARTVQVHIHNLRKKIEPDSSMPRYIKSVWGKGYLFHADAD